MIIDTHNDYLTKGVKPTYLDEREEYLKLLCSPVWTSEISDPMTKIKKAKEFLDSKKLTTELKLCVEDCWFLKEDNLEEFLNFQPFYTGLTWNDTNCLAGGCFGKGSISDFGKRVIKLFEKSGVIIDTAHLNRESFFDLAKLTSRPLFNSHTAVDALCNTTRNLTNEQLKIFKDTKGYIGVYFVTDFLSSGKVTSKTVADHIDYLVNFCGIDCVGFGTDFNGTDELPEDVKDYCDVENILMELKGRGYSDEALNKIRYNNFYEYLKK